MRTKQGRERIWRCPRGLAQSSGPVSVTVMHKRVQKSKLKPHLSLPLGLHPTFALVCPAGPGEPQVTGLLSCRLRIGPQELGGEQEGGGTWGSRKGGV